MNQTVDPYSRINPLDIVCKVISLALSSLNVTCTIISNDDLYF